MEKDPVSIPQPVVEHVEESFHPPKDPPTAIALETNSGHVSEQFQCAKTTSTQFSTDPLNVVHPAREPKMSAPSKKSSSAEDLDSTVPKVKSPR